MEYYSAIKVNEVLPFVVTWVKLEDIKWNKSDWERQVLYDLSYKWDLNVYMYMCVYIYIFFFILREAYRYREQIDGCQRHEVGNGGNKWIVLHFFLV